MEDWMEGKTCVVDSDSVAALSKGNMFKFPDLQGMLNFMGDYHSASFQYSLVEEIDDQ